MFHDHKPANEVGLKSCWIYRRHADEGFGATMHPGDMPRYDFRFTSMGELAKAHQARKSNARANERDQDEHSDCRNDGISWMLRNRGKSWTSRKRMLDSRPVSCSIAPASRSSMSIGRRQDAEAAADAVYDVRGRR